MKRILAVVFFLSVASFAGNQPNALGAWLQGGNSGEWFGMDWKHRVSSSQYTDLYFTFKSSNNVTSLGAYGGYYWHYNLIKADPTAGRFPLYWGPYGGLGFWHDGDSHVALRGGVVGGIAWVLPTDGVDIELWAELNPVAEGHFNPGDTVWEIPELYVRFGVRIYFF
jgi:hypothetical protein